MTCRARVADSARVSSWASVDSRPMNWACAGFGTVMGNRSSAAAAPRYLQELLSELMRRSNLFDAALPPGVRTSGNWLGREETDFRRLGPPARRQISGWR